MIGRDITILLFHVRSRRKISVFFNNCSDSGNGPSAEVELSSEKRILSFSIENSESEVIIDEQAKRIKVYVPYETDAASLIPVFELSESASITIPSGSVLDCLNTVVITVTAEDGTNVDYTLEVDVLSETALLVIDIQNALFPVYNQDEFLGNVSAMIDKAHDSGVKVVFLQFTNDSDFLVNSYGWSVHDSLSVGDEDIVIQKSHSNSFTGNNLNSELLELLVGRVVITGLQSQFCVRETCLGARVLNYEVILIEDAHSNNYENAELIIESTNSYFLNLGIVVSNTSDFSF
ncbi:MAG: isochorismatase family protein [bacterium]|nr:isochorismatase family protein [bacterium]